MQRVIEPELLDELPPEDRRAIRSREDLRRLNASMGNVRTAARWLRPALARVPRPRLLDLGAGDGEFFLRLARRLIRHGSTPAATLLDRQELLGASTRSAFSALGCPIETLKLDVLDWVRHSRPTRYDVILANLFLHHFPAVQLIELFKTAACRATLFIAIEPRRRPLVLLFSRMVGLIGCNSVTRHDAVVSVRAGFRNSELSDLWPADGNWRLREESAGLFSHAFLAHRREP